MSDRDDDGGSAGIDIPSFESFLSVVCSFVVTGAMMLVGILAMIALLDKKDATAETVLIVMSCLGVTATMGYAAGASTGAVIDAAAHDAPPLLLIILITVAEDPVES